MRIDKHIDKDNWYEIKDILHLITEIESLDLSDMGLTEFPKMSHITINDDFVCWNNQITSFKDCPIINGSFNCSYNEITSFEECPQIKYSFNCSYNEITSFKDCPHIGGDFFCWNNPIISFKDCPQIKCNFWCDSSIFHNVHKYSKEKKISYLEAQVELYNQKDEELLEHIDEFPDLVAYIRMKELSKLL